MQEFGKQQELGQERRGEHQAHASEAQEAEEHYSWPSQYQKMLDEGKWDLGLSLYINQFFAYTLSWNISPLSFFSECDRRNNLVH